MYSINPIILSINCFRGIFGCVAFLKKEVQKNPDDSNECRGSKKATTYSPTWYSSTIGADRLNFPVRNGKG